MTRRYLVVATDAHCCFVLSPEREEDLMVHYPELRREVQEVIASVDAEANRTKVSKEVRKEGRLLLSPVDMNSAIRQRVWGTQVAGNAGAPFG